MDDTQAPKINSGQDLLPLFKQLENSGDADISPAGAIGAYQIMPSVARGYGVDPAELFKPEVNLQIATQLANDLWKQYNGNPQDALVAWNAGTRRANRWIASGRTGFLPDETKNYVSRAQPFLKVAGEDLPPLQSTAKEPDNYVTEPTPLAPGQALMQKALDAGYPQEDIARWKQQKTDEATKAGYSPEDISKYWGEPEPDAAAVQAHQNANLAALKPEQQQKVAENPLEMMAAGWGMSVTGLAGGMPKYVMPEHMGVVDQMLSGVPQMVGDLPASILGMAIGAGAGGAAGAAVPVAGETGISEAAGGIVGAGAGFMAMPQAMREIMLDSMNAGQIHSFTDFVGMAGKSLINTGKAAAIGAISAPLGFGAAKLAKPLVGAAASKGVDALTQAVTMTAVGGALDGKMPDASNFAAATVLALGFHVAAARIPRAQGEVPALSEAGKTAQENMQHIYREYGIAPWQVLDYAKNDPSVRDALLTKDVNGEPAINAMKQYAQEEPPPYSPAAPTTVHYDAMGLTISPNWMLEGPYTKEPVVRTLPSGQVVPDPHAVADYMQAFGKLAGIKFNVGPEQRIASDNPARQTRQEQSNAPGPAYQSSKNFRPSQVYIPDNAEALNQRWYGLSTPEILFHELGHGLDFKMFNGDGKFSGFSRSPALRDEIMRASKLFAPKLWEINPSYRDFSGSEQMADAIAAYLSNPAARKQMPLFTAKYGAALDPYLDIVNKTLPKRVGAGWERPPGPDAKPAGEDGAGKPPGPPPPPAGFSNPEREPLKVEGPEPLTVSTEHLHEIMQEQMYGEKPPRESAFDVAKNYRQWISELGPAKEIDKMLMGLGFDAKHQLGLQDMFRQTYASDARAGSFITEGGFRISDDGKGFIKNDAPSVMDAVRQVTEDGGNLNDWKDYMVTRRAIDKEAKGKETGHPLTAEQREQLVKDGAAQYERATQTLQRSFDSVLDYGRDSGVFSQGQVDNMRAENPIYISFRRIMGDMTTSPSGSKRTFKVSAPLRAFEGTDKQIIDPLLASMDNIHQIVRMADRNRAVGSVVTLAKDNLKALGITVLPKPEAKATIAAQGEEMFKPYLAENTSTYEPFLAVRASRNDSNPNRFMFLRNGQPELWAAKDEALVKLIKGADTAGEANVFIEAASKFAEFQRAGIVSTPDFPLRNIWRDQLTAFVLDPLHPPPFVTWIGGLKDVLTKSPIYHQWVRDGGAGSALVELDKAYVAREFDKVSRSTGVAGAVWNSVTHPLEFAKIISERLDSASRLGYYKKAIAKGYDPLKAATMGRQAYIDYAERGTLAAAQTMARIVPFFRPNLLGLKQGWEAISERPMETLLYATAAITIPKLVMYAANYVADKELPEAEKYANLPRWEKDNYFITPQVGGTRFRMQMPQQLGVPFGGFPERMMDHFLATDPKAFDEFAFSLLNSYVPPVMPAAIRPAGEHYANRNFFTGKPLIPGALEQASGPLQYTPNTTEVAKAASKALAEADIDLSPIIMENYVRDYTGTGGMMILKALNAPFHESNKPLEVEDYPFISSFLVRNPGMGAQPVDEFFKARAEMIPRERDKVVAMARAKAGQNNAAEVETTAENWRPLAAIEAMTDTIHIMKSGIEAVNERPNITKEEYNKLSPEARAKTNALTVDEKRQLTDAMYSNMIMTAKAGLMAIEAMK